MRRLSECPTGEAGLPLRRRAACDAKRAVTSSPQGAFRFHHWFAFSLVLHAVLIVPCILVMWHAHRSGPIRSSKLHLEIFGMLSNRQVEARVQRHGAPPAQGPPKSPQQPVPSPEANNVLAENQVKVKGPDEKPQSARPVESQKQAIAGPVQGAPGASTYGDSEAQQTQQRIGVMVGSVDPTRLYVARLARSLRRNLAYPNEARKQKIEGSATVSFVVTESGGLKENSLLVKKSSGYSILDASALRSVRTSSPFEKPPRALRVTVTLTFNVEMGNGSAHRGSL